ncbi:MAG: hypothetical protein JF606_23900 [Burkholderiales bacterium]|nr:hypothetical protein [Burkholderiales bacterium]
MKTFKLSAIILLACVANSPDAFAKKKHETLLDSVVNSYQNDHSFQVPATGSIEVAFSPSEGSEALVIKVVDSARRELRILSYSFTSARRCCMDAKRDEEAPFPVPSS